MKKLTAGILASLIGLVSANSAEAAVASTKYVDEGLATKQDTLTSTNFIAPADAGDFITGFTVDKGTVTFTSGKLPDAAVVDAALSETSTNAIQNQAVAKKIAEMALSTDGQSGVIKTVSQTGGKVSVTSGTVVETDIADNAVTSAKIADGTIVTADIANSAVTSDKIADNAVTSAKIVDGTIVNADIADVDMSKVTGLDTALNAKQATLTSTNFKVAEGQSGDYVTGFTVTDGVVQFTKGTPEKAPVDTALSETSENAVQNKVITGTIYNMDFTATDTTGVVQNVSQADGVVSATFGKVTTEDIADNAVTSTQIADGTIVDADIKDVDMGKVTGLGDALDAKQAKLTQADNGGTGITIDATGKISADNQLNKVTGTGDDGLQVLTRKNCDAQGVCEYVWESIDRTFGD